MTKKVEATKILAVALFLFEIIQVPVRTYNQIENIVVIDDIAT